MTVTGTASILYYPDLNTFKKLAEDAELVPVYRRLVSDALTPVTAFHKIDAGRCACLFESVVGGEKVGRYSFLATEPFFEMIHKDIQHSKGVQLTQLPKPATGVVDIITITFDLRAIQSETMLAQRNAMAMGMNMQNQMNKAILAGQQAAINATNEG